jgi:hypothetical protein
MDGSTLTTTYTTKPPTAAELMRATKDLIDHIWGKEDPPKEERKLEGIYACPICKHSRGIDIDQGYLIECTFCRSNLAARSWNRLK